MACHALLSCATRVTFLTPLAEHFSDLKDRQARLSQFVFVLNINIKRAFPLFVMTCLAWLCLSRSRPQPTTLASNHDKPMPRDDVHDAARYTNKYTVTSSTAVIFGVAGSDEAGNAGQSLALVGGCKGAFHGASSKPGKDTEVL